MAERAPRTVARAVRRRVRARPDPAKAQFPPLRVDRAAVLGHHPRDVPRAPRQARLHRPSLRAAAEPRGARAPVQGPVHPHDERRVLPPAAWTGARAFLTGFRRCGPLPLRGLFAGTTVHDARNATVSSGVMSGTPLSMSAIFFTFYFFQGGRVAFAGLFVLGEPPKLARPKNSQKGRTPFFSARP